MKFHHAVAALTLACVAIPTLATSADYIVVLRDGVSPTRAAKRHGVSPAFIYEHALQGYAATLDEAQLRRARTDPAVLFIAEDRIVSLPEPVGTAQATVLGPLPQLRPFGIQRIGGLESPTAKIDKIDERVDVDIAILDTGVQMNHPDLNVVAGYNCMKNNHDTPPTDGNGHGTHVAGTAAAIDNAYGVVGVAPGARIWAVKVLDDTGFGTISQVICGVDWVTAHADVIDVANMSLSDTGEDDGHCGRQNADPLHIAICASVDAGVTYAVAAANDSIDTVTVIPAAYPEVITVSAIADFDGKPGGLAPVFPGCLPETDDTFAFFSNFGPAVDLAAPGVCILSTWSCQSRTPCITTSDGCYCTINGTSMATPHVAGAAALYLANHPDASPVDVRRALITHAEAGPIPEDPDKYHEGVVNVRKF